MSQAEHMILTSCIIHIIHVLTVVQYLALNNNLVGAQYMH